MENLQAPSDSVSLNEQSSILHLQVTKLKMPCFMTFSHKNIHICLFQYQNSLYCRSLFSEKLKK